MTSETADRPDEQAPAKRSVNARTAGALLSVALVFFGGVILAQFSGVAAAGIGAVGLGIVGLLLVTTGIGTRK